MINEIEHEITCYCEAKIKIKLPEFFDLESQPETIREICSGDFLKTTCPECGTELKPEFDLIFRYSNGDLIRFLPEIQREAFYKGNYDCSQFQDLLIGYPELREYFLIRNSSLSRFPVEAIKLHLLQKAPAGKSVEIYFEQSDQQLLTFHIFGLKADQVGLVTVPLSTYNSIKNQSSTFQEEEPYSAMLRGPYTSVKLVSFEEDNL